MINGGALSALGGSGMVGGPDLAGALWPLIAVSAATGVANTPQARKALLGGYPSQQYMYEALRARPNFWNPGFQPLAGGLGAGGAHYLNTSPQPQNQE
jgi:hypothetical protein